MENTSHTNKPKPVTLVPESAASQQVRNRVMSILKQMNLKNVLILGSSGMIGRLVLEECTKREDVQKITSITRKPSGIKHEKLVEVIHDDFLNYAAIEEHLKNQDVCFYCIGVYTGQVPTEEFKKITVDYTKAFADALKRNSSNAVFCFLSGQGADSTEKSNVLFSKQRGVAEKYLLNSCPSITFTAGKGLTIFSAL